MDKDFHYYGIGLLARAAGFSEQDALTIAHASQYIDDATESEPIRVGEMIFDPVRTAHYWLKAWGWSTQKRVFLPFHFILPKTLRTPADTFVTQSDSPLAKIIFEKACQEPDEVLRLISIGIALHTLAGAWSHQGFSGKEDPINDVEKIYRDKGNSWGRLLVMDKTDFSAIPVSSIIGKLLSIVPKRISLKWKYTRRSKKETVERDNTSEYTVAAETIYNLLISVEKPYSHTVLPWDQIKTIIHILLAYSESDVNKRCEKWREQYKNLFGDNQNYKYDEQYWRLEALKPQDKKDVTWVKFHRAALRQRHFVLEYCFRVSFINRFGIV